MKTMTLVITKEQAKMLLKALSTKLRGHKITMSVEVADFIIGGKKTK
ncbi:MAG: hypothetical protein ABIP51_01290 [Bacteroidia bacterium]